MYSIIIFKLDRPRLKMAKEGIVHIKNMQSNKMNITQQIA